MNANGDTPRYKMIAADLDGTLRPERQPPRPRVVAAVRRAQEAGVRVVMATGRTFRTAQPFIEPLGLRDAAICDQGASIYDVPTGALLYEIRVPAGPAKALLAYAQTNQLTFVACIDNDFYAPRVTEHLENFVGPFRDHLHIPTDWTHLLEHGAQKISFINDPATTTHILYDLRAQFSDQLQIVQSYVLYVEITHPAASKGRAVEWLAKRWDIPQTEVLAIGDHDNDRSMIQWAGLGIAMGNAADVLKDVADFIVPSADEDGAAEAIDKFVLDAGRGLP